MAFSTDFSNPQAPRKIVDMGIFAGGAREATALTTGDWLGGALWLYRSTHSSSEIISTGFFKACSILGMSIGDVLINFPQSSQSSSKMTMHPVIQSSFDTTRATTSSTFGGYMNLTAGTAT